MTFLLSWVCLIIVDSISLQLLFYVIITSLLINVVEAFTYFKYIIHSLINKTSSHDFSFFIVRMFSYW